MVDARSLESLKISKTKLTEVLKKRFWTCRMKAEELTNKKTGGLK